LADLTTQSAGKVPMILCPYLPNQDDSLASESNVILLSLSGVDHLGLDAENHFKQLEFSQVLTTLWDDRKLTGLDLFFDSSGNLQDQHMEALNIVLSCYPGAILSKTGQFFSVYHFDEEALSQPKCYQGAHPLTITPQDGAVLPSDGPLAFSWDTNGVESTSYSHTLERKTTDTYWIEVEDAYSGPVGTFPLVS
jgi:hypothetical protein